MAKCQCGREMLKANGCRFKRMGLRRKRISAAAIAEQKSASIITRIAITRDVRFVAASF